MTDQMTVLTDADERIWLDAHRIETPAGDALPGNGHDTSPSIEKWTIRGGPGNGIDVVDVDNGRFSVSILPTRGMGLWKARYDALDLGWRSPVQRPVHPAMVRPGDNAGSGWLAGFNELLARCGLASHGPPATDEENGQSTTLHGNIANIPAHRVTAGIHSDGELWVRGEVDETSLFGPCLRLDSTVSTQPGSNRLTLNESVTNLASGTAEFELLYHTNIGPPLLEHGARIAAPARRVIPSTSHAAAGVSHWDVFEAPQTGYVEECYFLELAADQQGQTLVVLHDADAQQGIALEFSVEPLPCFTLWKNTVGESDGYVPGIEPSTDLPNPRQFERDKGRLMTLEPGQTWTATIALVALVGNTEIAQQLSRIKDLTPEEGTQLCSAPLESHTATR